MTSKRASSIGQVKLEQAKQLEHTMDSLDLLNVQQDAHPKSLLDDQPSYDKQQQYNHRTQDQNSQDLKQMSITDFFREGERQNDASLHDDECVVREAESDGGDSSDRASSQPEKADDDAVDEVGENGGDDDEAFVALCTDASSVLNYHDPIRRYHINKLYQPMNGQQDSDTPLADQDDEYLLYQELRFLESTAQELTDDRQRRMQLTKILEDDDGDDDIDHLNEDEHGEDPLDRIHLTTIIEAFESFTSSPLIESCQETDPLISQASCAICSSHEECDHDKPDSTRHGDLSPSSTDSGNGTSMNNLISNYASSVNQFNCEHDDLQLGQQQQHHNHLDHTNNQTPHYNLSFDTDNQSSTTIKHNQHDQYDNHISQQQQQPDDSSEISCFQQVSSTLMPVPKSVAASPTSLDNDENSQCKQQQNEQLDCTEASTRKSSSDDKHAKKRNFKQNADDEDADGDAVDASKASTKNRVKRRKINAKDDNIKSCRRSPNDNGVSSTMLGHNIHTSSDAKSIYKTNYCHQIHISKANPHEDCMDSLGEDEEGEATTSNLDHRQPHVNKYKRRTANARERIRMREINQAFEKLKKVVPIEMIQQATSGDESDQTSASSRRGGKSSTSGSESVKLTKITTLRLAKSYIEKLSEILSQHPPGNSDGSSEQNNQAIVQTQIDGAKKSTKNTSRRKRIRRNVDPKPSTVSSQVKLVGIPVAKQTDRDLQQAHKDKEILPDVRVARPEMSVVLNQGGQTQPIIITNTMNGGQRANTFIPIQAHQQHQPQHQQQQQQQQYTFARCNQQPLTISTNINNGHDRTFVTPVAVAILGIPAGANNQRLNEPQALQLVGIQSSPQQMQFQQQVHRQQQQHTIQTNNPTYNLISPQSQPVTFTLDDINGLSVLRLANQPAIGAQQATAIQLQQTRAIVQQQQPQFITTTTTGYNYTAYQPMQFSQVQPSANMTTLRQVNSQQPAAFRFNQAAIINNSPTTKAICNESSEDRNNIVSAGNNNLVTATCRQQPVTATTITTGTNNSDCRSFGLSPNTIAQNLNSNINNLVQATQINIQQSNPSHIANNGHLVALPAGTHLVQAQTVGSSLNGGSQTQTQTNLIYINSANQNNNGESTTTGPRHQHQILDQAASHSVPTGASKDVQCQMQPISSNGSFEQVKFVAQCSQQVRDKSSNEANIRQLVASLTTSIEPNGTSNTCDRVSGDAKEQQFHQQHQAKRTYRFHNYDGNMITNHLYNTNHDKQPQNQQPTNKKGHQNPQANNQRSRQNSLSSTCSTTSSSSSSLIASCSASPSIAVLPTSKSPPDRATGDAAAPILIDATGGD